VCLEDVKVKGFDPVSTAGADLATLGLFVSWIFLNGRFDALLWDGLALGNMFIEIGATVELCLANTAHPEKAV